MESFYSYYAPKTSELPELSSSEIVTIHGRIYKVSESEKDAKDKFARFWNDFRSLFWFSYRKDFAAISPSTYTSDLGWGCMLRSGQMMLAQAICRHLLGRDWQRTPDSLSAPYFQLLKLFEDNPNAPFSVHKIAQVGMKYKKAIGEWFGPSTVAQALNDLNQIYPVPDLVMYTSNESSLYLDEITALCTKDSPNNKWKSLFIMIPLRLGLDSLNAVYFSSLQGVFKMPQSLGIVGGKPRAAMYFIGYQDSHLLCMDPHVVQPAVDMSGEFPTESYHCSAASKMPMSGVDPSLAIGFYCSDKKEFEDFWKNAKQLSSMEHPILGVDNCAPDYRQKGKKETLSVEGFEDDIVIL